MFANDVLDTSVLGPALAEIGSHTNAGGGRRYGGSWTFPLATGNTLFRLCSATALTDSTTRMKMFQREVFPRLKLTGVGAGWSCAFKMSIRAQLLGLRPGEVPIASIDRLFGGESTFRPLPWSLAYSKVFLWGAVQMPPWYSPRRGSPSRVCHAYELAQRQNRVFTDQIRSEFSARYR
jgi:hypothetical protein